MDIKGKDCSPYETIRKIKEFLLSNEIMVTEKWKYDYVGLYSVRVVIENTAIGSNGKGTSKIYALASAYGELMERLQNFVMFRLNMDYFHWDNRDFQDRKRLTFEEYGETIDNLQKLIPHHHSFLYLKKGLEKYAKVRGTEKVQSIIFREYRKQTQYDMPVDLLDLYYASNGMSAGNSEAEAYVQGLSEVLERYVVKEIVFNKLTPPSIDENVLRSLDNYKEICAYMQRIESSGQFKLSIYDLSLGQELPVVGLVLFNILENSYFVKVGSHPIIEIAIERCFTELLQGQNIETFTGMIRISDNQWLVTDKMNLMNYFTNGRGAFPIEFFGNHPSYNSSLKARKFNNNEEMKRYITDLITNMGFTILVHDSTFTDIYSFHFVVPGMSELMLFSEQDFMQLCQKVKVGRIINDGIRRISLDEAHTILDYLCDNNIDESSTMEKLIPFCELDSCNIYSKTPIGILKFRLYLFLKDYQHALNQLKRYANELRIKNQRSIFIDCYITFLELYDKISLEDIERTLSLFYSKKTIENVLKDFWGHPFDELPDILCNHDCDRCIHKECCYGPQNRDIYNKLVELAKTDVNSNHERLIPSK